MWNTDNNWHIVSALFGNWNCDHKIKIPLIPNYWLFHTFWLDWTNLYIWENLGLVGSTLISWITVIRVQKDTVLPLQSILRWKSYLVKLKGCYRGRKKKPFFVSSQWKPEVRIRVVTTMPWPWQRVKATYPVSWRRNEELARLGARGKSHWIQVKGSTSLCMILEFLPTRNWKRLGNMTLRCAFSMLCWLKEGERDFKYLVQKGI